MATNERWSGRLGFVAATIASAVGIGSIWKFPYEVGANGGAGFIVFYLLGLALIVGPLMLAEFAIGRRGKSDARASIVHVASAHGRSRGWAVAGAVGVLAAFLILSFYSVIGGWALGYAIETAWRGLSPADSAQARLDGFLAAPATMATYHAIFMAMTALIVARGIAGGIEEASKFLTPALVILMAALAIYGIVDAGIGPTLRFMFAFDPASLTARAAIEALGLGFFSIGVGLAVMITYAAYAGPEIDLRQAAIIAILGDTAISFLAGFAVFPIVFAHGLDPSSGPGLIFVTLPVAFASVPFGQITAVAFFVLLVVAALGSAISLLEMPVAFARRSLGWSRPRAVVVTATACWALGLATVFSFNAWRDWHPLAEFPGFERATFFDVLDYLTSNVLLPFGGMILTLFVGWALPGRFLREELAMSPVAAGFLHMLLRIVVPLGIAAASVLPFVLR